MVADAPLCWLYIRIRLMEPTSCAWSGKNALVPIVEIAPSKHCWREMPERRATSGCSALPTKRGFVRDGAVSM